MSTTLEKPVSPWKPLIRSSPRRGIKSDSPGPFFNLSAATEEARVSPVKGTAGPTHKRRNEAADVTVSIFDFSSQREKPAAHRCQPLMSSKTHTLPPPMAAVSSPIPVKPLPNTHAVESAPVLQGRRDTLSGEGPHLSPPKTRKLHIPPSKDRPIKALLQHRQLSKDSSTSTRCIIDANISAVSVEPVVPQVAPFRRLRKLDVRRRERRVFDSGSGVGDSRVLSSQAAPAPALRPASAELKRYTSAELLEIGANLVPRYDTIRKKLSCSEAHVLSIDPHITNRRPVARRLNSASDPVRSTAPKHVESIEYQATQFIAHTLKPGSLLNQEDSFQRALLTTPLAKKRPVSKRMNPEETSYQSMLKKAYIDERPFAQSRTAKMLGRRHEVGSGGRSEIVPSMPVLQAESTTYDQIKRDEFLLMMSHVARTENFLAHEKGVAAELGNKTNHSPVRDPVSPRKSLRPDDERNFAARRVRDLNSARVPLSPSGLIRPGYAENFVEMRQRSPSAVRIKAFGPFQGSRPFAHAGLQISPEHRRLIDKLHADSELPQDEVKELDEVVKGLEKQVNALLKGQAPLEIEPQKQKHNARANTVKKTQDVKETATEPHTKSAMSMSHRVPVQQKSVRWDPEVVSIGAAVPEKKNSPGHHLRKLFEQVKESNNPKDDEKDVDEAVATLRQLKKLGKKGKLGAIMQALKDMDSGSDEEMAAKSPKDTIVNVKEVEVVDETQVTTRGGRVASDSSPILTESATVSVAVSSNTNYSTRRLNPAVPEFNPRSCVPMFGAMNAKENDAWGTSATSTPRLKATDLDMPASMFSLLPPPALPLQERTPSPFVMDPAIIAIGPKTPPRKSFARELALLESKLHSPERALYDRSPHKIYQNPLYPLSDPAVVEYRYSPERPFFHSRHPAPPTPAGTQTMPTRKRIIWDNPDDPGGREAVIQSRRYAEEYLEGFTKKYPLTGQKATVVPKKKLEDLPPMAEPEGALKAKRLATEAAEIQQKLELLLLKKKEAKVLKMRKRGSEAWGVGSVSLTGNMERKQRLTQSAV